MKKVLALVAAAGLMTAATAAFGGSIVQSKHNLSSTGQGTFKGASSNTSQICVYCHAPHNAGKAVLLWNRVNPDGATFTLYSGVNMANTSFKSGFTSDSTSLFCMSCHDGSTLGDTNVVSHGANIANGGDVPFDNGPAGRVLNNKAITGNAKFGTDLSKTHPVNFAVTSDSQSDLYIGTGGTMGGNGLSFPLFKATGRDGGSNRALECGSCHAVHDSQYSPFLRATMDGSALCLGCHNK